MRNTEFTWSTESALHIIRDRLTRYTTAVIIQCPVTSELLQSLSVCCPNLQVIALYACNLQGASPYRGLVQFTNVRTLDWRLTNGFLTELSHLSVECKTVENLGLGRQLSAVAPDKLFLNHYHLKIIDCHESLFITDRSLKVLAQHCPQLVSVSFINCANLAGTTLPHLVTACSKLQTLRMRGPSLRAASFQEVHWKQTYIMELDLQNITGLSEGIMTMILNSLRHLRYLRCSFTTQILNNLRSGLPELEVLKLRSNYPLTRESLTAFLCACPNLMVLDISTEPVHAEEFVTFLPHLPNMKYLSMAGTSDIDITIELLELFCPVLEVLCIQFYRACTNTRLSETLISLIRARKHVRKVMVSGINVDAIVEETRSRLDGKLGTRKVDVIEDEFFEGMEEIPPRNSLDGVLGTTFPDYHVISEKRLPGARTLSISRFLNQRQARQS